MSRRQPPAGRISWLGLCLLTSCKEVTAFVPASAADVRAGAEIARDADPMRVAVRDELGVAHAVDWTTPVRLHSNQELQLPYGDRAAGPSPVYELNLGQLSLLCSRAGSCPLDDATARWELGVKKQVPDGRQVAFDSLTLAVVGGLLTANIVCFGVDSCSVGGKVAVGLADGALVVGSVAAFVIILKAIFQPRD